jgi:DNA (cytosine-5)-methyltransferase 1
MIGFDNDSLPNAVDLFDFPKKEILTSNIKEFLDKKVDEKYFYRDDKYMYDMLVKDIKNENTIYRFLC